MPALRVVFGRANGEKTLGEIIKFNRAKAKVRILESRGSHSPVGAVWGVPYSMMKTETGEEVNQHGVVPKTYTAADLDGADALSRGVSIVQKAPERPKFDPMTLSAADVHIVRAIVSVYTDLSPENLTCDGELRYVHVMAKKRELDSKLRALFTALGHEIDESEAYAAASANA